MCAIPMEVYLFSACCFLQHSLYLYVVELGWERNWITEAARIELKAQERGQEELENLEKSYLCISLR